MQDILINEVKAFVRSRLSESRWQHTLGVAETSAWLSDIVIPDKKTDVIIAALFHDVAKELTSDEQHRLISELGVAVLPEELQTEAALHCFAAVALIKRDFPHLANPEILSAVHRHTLGAGDMSVFDKIVYIADYIEPGRTNSACRTTARILEEEISRATTFDDASRAIDRAILLSLDNTAKYLAARGLPVNPIATEMRKSLIT